MNRWLFGGGRLGRGESWLAFLIAMVSAIIVLSGALVLAAMLSGCASTQPTAAERRFFDVTTNFVPHIEVVTNYQTFTQPVTNYLSVTSVVTNIVGVTVPVTNFVPITAYVTNEVAVPSLRTNLEEEYVLTTKSTTKAAAAVAGTIANAAMPGIGSLVSAGLLGIVGIFAGYRNRQLSKSKQENDVLSQSAGVLAQIIETAREVMATTPQGAEAADRLSAWMVSHQAETGTIAKISEIVKSAVDNDQAKRAAGQMLALIGQGQGPTAPGAAKTF